MRQAQGQTMSTPGEFILAPAPSLLVSVFSFITLQQG